LANCNGGYLCPDTWNYGPYGVPCDEGYFAESGATECTKTPAGLWNDLGEVESD